MAQFLTGNELNTEIERIFESAKEQIILISPYIKLHNRYSSTLKAKFENPKLKIIVVFGKNELDMSKSMKKEDFDFFKEFPNIEIRYEKRLHAKYYANETSAILTSMNLYEFSQDNNIEAGVLSKTTLLGEIAQDLVTNVTGGDSYDKKASNYFLRVIDQSEILFQRIPKFEKTLLGLKQNYVKSKTKEDKLSEFFESKRIKARVAKKVLKPLKEKSDTNSSVSMGFCIRTGKPIPFNPKKPLCSEAYKLWSKFGDKTYSEKFCHFSGELSNKQTSVDKPILRKNWNSAKEKYNL